MAREHREIFNALEQFLNSVGLSWIPDQVRRELATGRLTEERLSTVKESREDPETLVKHISGDFVRRQDYSDSEALVLMLEAARRGICEPALMAEEIGRSLGMLNIASIEFEGEQELPILIDPQPVARHGEALTRAAQAIDEIIGRIRSG